MPSGWDVYYVVFLSALLALGIPAVLALISWIVSPPSKRVAAESSKAAQDTTTSHLGKRTNARFFLAANTALVLIALALILVPCVSTLQSGSTRQGLLRGLISIGTVAGFASLGLLYSARKGDLSWLRSYQEPK